MAVARSIEMVVGFDGLKLMVKLFDNLMGCLSCWKCCGAGQTARTVLLTTNHNVNNHDEEDIFARMVMKDLPQGNLTGPEQAT